MTQSKYRAIVIAAIALAALAAGAAWYFVNSPDSGEGTSYSRYLPRLSKASAAKIPDGFPIYYVLGANPEVIKGSKETDAYTNATTYLLETTVESNPQAVFNEYKEFFEKTEWTIRAQYLGSTAGSITAEKGGETVVVAIASSGRSTTLAIRYRTSNGAR